MGLGIGICASYLHGSVVWVQQKLSKCDNLRRPVPPVGAVHEHRSHVPVDGNGDGDGRPDKARDMVEPFGALQCAEPAGKVPTNVQLTLLEKSRSQTFKSKVECW